MSTTAKTNKPVLTFFRRELYFPETPRIAAWGNTVTEELTYAISNTDMGRMGILGLAKGLLRTTLPQRSTQEVRRLLGDSINNATWSLYLFQYLMEQLRNILVGHKVTFPDELDLSHSTTFQRKVWK